MRRIKTGCAALVCALICCLVAGCPQAKQGGAESTSGRNSSATSPASQKKLIIAVSYPLEYLTKRIAEPDFEVVCPVPDNQQGSTWKPDREAIMRMQSAEMVVANGKGARYAKWLTMAAIPAGKVCNSATQGLALSDFIEIDDVRYTHSHGNLGEHSHPTNCPYTWLHPEIALKQAKFIHSELVRKYPAQAEGFTKRFSELTTDLMSLQDEFNQISETAEAEFSTVLTATPDLKFFTRACNWNDMHLKWFEPPDPATAAAELETCLNRASDRPLVKRDGKILLLSPYPFSDELLTHLESYKVSVVVIDKMDQRPSSGDYFSVMRENVNRLKSAKSNQQETKK